MVTKRCFIDVETTGLNAVKNGIHQIAALLEIDGEVIWKMNEKVKPFPDDIINSKALSVSGVKEEDLKADNYVDPKSIYEMFTLKLSKHIDKFSKSEKIHFVAYNAMFDWNFMWEWFKKCGDKYFGAYFFYPPLDVMVSSAYYLESVRHKMEDFKLPTVAKQLGIDLDNGKLHDAYYDISLTRRMYYTLQEL